MHTVAISTGARAFAAGAAVARTIKGSRARDRDVCASCFSFAGERDAGTYGLSDSESREAPGGRADTVGPERGRRPRGDANRSEKNAGALSIRARPVRRPGAGEEAPRRMKR